MPPNDSEEYAWQAALWCRTKAIWDTATEVDAIPPRTLTKFLLGFIKWCGYVPPKNLQAYLQNRTQLARSGADRVWPGL